MKGPLEGIKVLDLTKAVSGPFATFFLQELGAEIIKVELPEKGDETRHFGPFVSGNSSYFAFLNRGKKSITLNLKDEKDKKILWALIEHSDVLVENFKPGTLSSLGFGEKVVKEKNPNIIYASCSGFGQEGPYSSIPAYDIVMQAMSGVMSITGEEGSEGSRIGTPFGDFSAGILTAFGILSALYARQTKGTISRVDVSMLDSLFLFLETPLLSYLNEGKVLGPTGNRHPFVTPFQCYKARDAQLAVATGNDRLFALLCKVLQLEELSYDPRFVTNLNRTKNYKELNALFEKKFLEKTVDEWLVLLKEVGIPSSKINSVKDVALHPQIKARNMVVEIENPEGISIKAPGNPIKLSAYKDLPSRSRAPKLDEHREEILKSLGLDNF